MIETACPVVWIIIKNTIIKTNLCIVLWMRSNAGRGSFAKHLFRHCCSLLKSCNLLFSLFVSSEKWCPFPIIDDQNVIKKTRIWATQYIKRRNEEQDAASPAWYIQFSALMWRILTKERGECEKLKNIKHFYNSLHIHRFSAKQIAFILRMNVCAASCCSQDNTKNILQPTKSVSWLQLVFGILAIT